MAATTYQPAAAHGVAGALHRARSEPAYGAYLMLRAGFTVLPIVFGADKFANVLTNWERYLAPWIVRIIPLTAHQAMLIVGVIEIAAGIAVAVKPRYAAYVVAAWLAGIVINLVSYPGFYDVALRDFGLMLAALSLARLASVYDPRGAAAGLARAADHDRRSSSARQAPSAWLRPAGPRSAPAAGACRPGLAASAFGGRW